MVRKKGGVTKSRLQKRPRIDRSSVIALMNDLNTRFNSDQQMFDDARKVIESKIGIDVLKAPSHKNLYKPAREKFKRECNSPYMNACVPIVRRILTNCRNAVNTMNRRKRKAAVVKKIAELYKEKFLGTKKKLDEALCLARKYGAPENEISSINESNDIIFLE